LSGVKTLKQKKRFQIAERDYFLQNRSQQLLEYKRDKEISKTKDYLDVPSVSIDAAKLPCLSSGGVPLLSACMEELLQKWLLEKNDLALFIPTSNSPPAALRYYGTMKQAPISPFLSSTERKMC